jgi:hypothetical protein
MSSSPFWLALAFAVWLSVVLPAFVL